MRLALVLVAACGFSPASSALETVSSDAPADGPRLPDAPAIAATCAISVAPPGSNAGKVGGSTGGTAATTPLVCPDGQPMIGVALDVSNQPTGGPAERSALGIELICAATTIGSGAPTGTTTILSAQGNGGANWSPATLTPVTLCPSGSVIGGMLVHSGPTNSAFVNASIHCVELDAQAHAIAAQDVDIAGSLDEMLNPNGAACSAGQVVSAVTPSTGAGLDSLELACAVPTCR